MEDIITLACGVCKRRNYTTLKNKKNDPDRIELSYIPVSKSSFIVPFAFISVAAPGSTTPCVQFFPEYLSHCVVYDVHVTKV